MLVKHSCLQCLLFIHLSLVWLIGHFCLSSGLSEDSSGGYVWADGLSANLSAGRWADLQPDVSYGACVTADLSSSTNLWSFDWCYQTLPFVCQRAASVEGMLTSWNTMGPSQTTISHSGLNCKVVFHEGLINRIDQIDQTSSQPLFESHEIARLSQFSEAILKHMGKLITQIFCELGNNII